MQKASKEEIISAIEDSLPLLAGCLQRAWNTYQNSYPVELRVQHSSRSRASLVHDHAIAYARESFESRIGSSCQVINKLFLVCFSNGIVVRFKKLDERLRASNIATQQSMDFLTQESLPNIDLAVNLHAGYRLNKLETDIEGMYITRPSGPDSNAWFLPLEYAPSNVVHIPQNNVTPVSDAQIVKFSPRKKDQGNEAAQ